MKRKIVTILAYTVLVAVVLFMSQCEQGITLTTVKRDAKYINELALRVESEEELKHVEKLARQYEIGYLKAYNGAMSLEFKRLTNEALREAGYICDEIHAENERIATMQNTFHSALHDLETAWSHNISSKDNDLAQIAKNNERIAEIEAEIEQVRVESDKLYDLIIEKCYPEDLLAQHDVLKEQIVGLEAQIAKINDANRIIRLAYKLHNLELEAPVVEEVVETEEAEEAATTEQTTEIEGVEE